MRSAARPGRFEGFQVLPHPKKRPGPPGGRLWVRVLPGFGGLGGLDALVQLRGEGLGLGDLVCGHLGFQIVSQACGAGLVAVGGGEVVPGMSLDEVGGVP